MFVVGITGALDFLALPSAIGILPLAGGVDVASFFCDSFDVIGTLPLAVGYDELVDGLADGLGIFGILVIAEACCGIGVIGGGVGWLA